MASWSRVQGTGLPTVTAVEIMVIWVLSVVLAVPDAVTFTMVPSTYNNHSFNVCMLSHRNTPFLKVSLHSESLRMWACVCLWEHLINMLQQFLHILHSSHVSLNSFFTCKEAFLSGMSNRKLKVKQ